MEALKESGGEELRKVEGDLDLKLSSQCNVDGGSPTMEFGRSWKSMEMEIESLLEKLPDIINSTSECAASAAPTTSVTHKLA